MSSVWLSKWYPSLFRALVRARLGLTTIALTYALSVTIGAVMVHAGNEFALKYRDDLIGRARASDPALAALREGRNVDAALSDFRGNLFAAVSDTVGGVGIIFPYPFVAYRGWIGGIVSVDDSHVSRLADQGRAFYYLLTMVLQLIPYSMAGGVGVNLGIAYFRPQPYYQGDKWFGVPKEAIRDALRVYVLIVPLFLIASLWEFLA